MNAGAEGFDEESPEVFDFLDEYLTDLENGRDLPLSHYLSRYAGFEEAISREYLHRKELEARRSPEREVGAESPETRIGPYRLLSELGRGGQGIVYLAEDTRIERRVALKLLPPAALLVSEDRRARMRREAEVVSRLDHPGICGIFDAEISTELAYIAMPFVEGRTLGAAIAAAREGSREDVLPLAPEGQSELFELLGFFESAARALHAAHEAGIVHRDIKPGNLMITPEGVPIWLDFGQALDTESTAMQLTLSGEVFGTPAYMSPEQIGGPSRRIDARTDVWALAVSLFEALTLERPFEGASAQALLLSVQIAEPRSARELNPAIPAELDVVLQTALEKDLSRRYASALELAEELARIRSFEPIRAQPASTALRFRRWTRRHPVLFVSITAAFLALSAGLVWTLYLLAREQRALDFAVGRHLAQRSTAMIDEEPAVSLALGIEAVERAPTYLTRAALYRALGACYLKCELVGEPARRFRDLEVLEGGEVVAAALQDGTGRLYAAWTGEELARWQAHEGEAVEAVLVSTLGYLVATGGTDGRVCLYDRKAGGVIARFDGPGGEIRDLCLDGPTIAVRGSEGPPVVYTVPEGRLLGPLPGASESGARISRSHFLGLGYLETPQRGATLDRLRTWSVEGDLIEGPYFPKSPEVRAHAAARGTTDALLAGEDGRLHDLDLWNGRPNVAAPLDLGGIGELIARPPMAASDDPAFVAVRRGDQVRGVLANHEARRVLELCPPRPEAFVDAAFSPNGTRLATVREDGVVRIWDVPGLREVARFQFQLRPVELAWAGNRYLVTQSNGPEARVWYGGNRPDLYTLYCGGAVRDVCFSPDGERALTLSDDGFARLWSTPSEIGGERATGALLAEHPLPDGSPAGAQFDESGERVLLWSPGGVDLWELESGSPGRIVPGDGTPLTAAFQPGGYRILIVEEKRGAWTIDGAEGGAPIRYGEPGGVRRGELSPDGRLVATAHDDGTLRLWETATGALSWEREHGNETAMKLRIVDLAFDPGGTELAAARDDRRVYFYEVGTGSLSHRRFRFGIGEEQQTRDFMRVFPPRDLDWSSDGRHLLVTGAFGRGAFDIRDLEAGSRVSVEVFHEDDITTGSFSPDGTQVLTSSKDGTIFIRNPRDGKPVVHLEADGGVALDAAFSGGPGPLRVIAGFEDGTVRIWPVDPLPWAKARKPRELGELERRRETRLAKPLEYP